jgi:hypothetical protein
MSFNGQLLATGGVAQCLTDSVQVFGADGTYTSNIALYQLDSDGGTTNNVPDTTTNYNGTATSITYSPGKFGNAAVFNGSNSKISTGIPLSSSDNYSMSMWIYMPSSSSYGDFLAGNVDGTAKNGFYVSVNTDGTGRFYLRPSSGSASTIIGTTVMATGQWNHFAITSSSTTNSLYINGQLDGTASRSSVTFASTITLGRAGAYSADYFAGSIDQVRIFDKAINAEDVATLYVETSSTASNTNPFNEGAGVALYTMDYDASDAGGLYDGTPTDVTFGVGGQINTAAGFNGSSSKIVTGLTLPADSSMSFSLWFKTATTGVNQSLFGETDSSFSNLSIRIGLWWTNANTIYVWIANGSSEWYTTLAGVSYLDDNWHNFVLSINGTSVKLYADGSQTPIIDATSSVSFGTTGVTPLTIGAPGSAYSGYFWTGSIDQVRIFSKALNSTEVGTLFAEIACNYICTTDTVNYPTTNLAYYKLDNSADDETGVYDGTSTNVTYTFGRFGQAAVFNGSSSYISTGINFSTLPNTKSISMWVKSTGSSSIGFGGMDGSSSNNGLFAFDESAGDLSYIPKFGGYHNGDASNVVTNAWNHFVVTDTNVNGNVKMYINGSEVTVTKINSTAYTNNTDMQIGRQMRNNGSAFFQTGTIDQIRIFNTALSASNVTNLYNEKPCADTSNFKTVLYEGNGGSQYISNVGFEPDFTWIKARETADNNGLYDIVRGAGNLLESNTTSQANSYTTVLNSFLSNGFTVGSSSIVNVNNNDYVSWNWKAGGDASDITSSSSNVSAASLSANAEAGFSIATYTTNSDSPVVIPHGLDSTPKVALVKRTDSSSDWFYYNTIVSGRGRGFLNNNSAFDNGGMPTLNGTNITFAAGDPFSSGSSAVIYFFAEVGGYSKISTYTGASTPNAQNIGFRPSFILLKGATINENWSIYDSTRGTTQRLYPDLANAEYTYSSALINFTDNGFEFATTSNSINGSGQTYTYMAFK